MSLWRRGRRQLRPGSRRSSSRRGGCLPRLACPALHASSDIQLILAFSTLCFGFSDAALLFSVAACRESAEALSAAIEREADLRAALAEASSRLEQAAAGAGLLPCAVLWCPIPAATTV
jgi:hypothetical protein